jgi:hypothetical protein
MIQNLYKNSRTSATSPLTVKAASRGDMLRLSISGSSAVSDATGITFGSATYDKAQIIAYNENTGNAAGYLTFWTGGSPATTDMTERMRITSAGQVYVGGTSISNGARFGIIGGGVWDGATLGLQNTGTSGQTYTIFSTNSSFSQGAGNIFFSISSLSIKSKVAGSGSCISTLYSGFIS